MREALGPIGAGIVAVAAIYYLWDVIRGDSRPHSGSWLVWTIIGILGFGATSDAGAGPGSYAAAVYVVAYAVTFLVSLHPKYGKPGIEWYDWPLCLVAILGIVLWRFGPLSTPAAATLAVVCDGIGLWPTLREAWRNPEAEARLAWTGDAIGTSLCLVASIRFSYSATIYPMYLVAATASTAVTLVMGRAKRR